MKFYNQFYQKKQQQSSKYQCFRYERHYSEEKGGIVVKMAQSYSGACEGLWSAEEGDKTYTLWTGNYFKLILQTL